MKCTLQTFLIFILLTIVAGSSAQSYTLTSGNKKAVKYYKEAETAFRSSEFEKSRENLLKSIKKDDEFIEAWLLLGDVNNELGRKTEAINAFKTAIRIDSSFFPKAWFFLGNLAFGQGEYTASVSYYKQYLQFDGEQEVTKFLARKRLKRSFIADSLLLHPVETVPVNMGSTINTASDEYINFINESFKKLFLTRKMKSDTGIYGQTIFAEHFFEAETGSAGWITTLPMKTEWMEGLNTGGMNLSVDGRKMYFTGCNWAAGYGSCDLYVSRRTGKTWGTPVNLGAVVNSQWWDSQPVVSADGNRIYFSSKRPGGKGGADLWMTVKLDNGKWSPPVNLGDSINTGGNEMAPFLHADGKTLYFSSDGHNGLGGADLFISRLDEVGRWSRAKNLGYPVNSRFNEINLFMSLDGEFAWLSSDKPGGEGGFDIYQVRSDENFKPASVYFIKGIVRDKSTGEPLEAAVTLTNLEKSLVVDHSDSDPQTGEFLMVLNYGTEYAFNITKTGYLFYSEHLDLTRPVSSSVEKIFQLEPVEAGSSFVLENVFFDFDESTLQPRSYAELSRLVGLLNENPDIRIMIGGHTDTVGSDEYNRQLSDERAEVVFRYLIDRGISSERLQFKGFGSEKPVADNTTGEGRARNRRTEVLVLEN